MIIRPQTREWLSPILTAHTTTGTPITIPPDGWEATFDNGTTWLPSRDTGDGAPGWLIADPTYPGPGDTDSGIPTDHVLTAAAVAAYIRLRDMPETITTGPILIRRQPY